MKAVLNKAGLNQSTSISSRAFELFREGKAISDVAIQPNLDADEAIRLHHQYSMLAGWTEFTKVYLQTDNLKMLE
jgi:hypothetical protein